MLTSGTDHCEALACAFVCLVTRSRHQLRRAGSPLRVDIVEKVFFGVRYENSKDVDTLRARRHGPRTFVAALQNVAAAEKPPIGRKLAVSDNSENQDV